MENHWKEKQTRNAAYKKAVEVMAEERLKTAAAAKRGEEMAAGEKDAATDEEEEDKEDKENYSD
jgi:hypothetical protein